MTPEEKQIWSIIGAGVANPTTNDSQEESHSKLLGAVSAELDSASESLREFNAKAKECLAEMQAVEDAPQELPVVSYNEALLACRSHSEIRAMRKYGVEKWDNRRRALLVHILKRRSPGSDPLEIIRVMSSIDLSSREAAEAQLAQLHVSAARRSWWINLLLTPFMLADFNRNHTWIIE